jgi:hypothetical protein
MPAAPQAFERLARRMLHTIEHEPDRARRLAEIDAALDMWNDYEQRATNWDARQWGLDADDPVWWRPMEEGRTVLTREERKRLERWADA